MNRPTETVDLSTRELLWKLPELLEGEEPVLSRPAVRKHLQRDPEARLAIVAVAELSHAIATGRRASLLPASRSEALRGPAAAVRHFRHQLSRLLFDCGLVHFNEGTAESAAFSSQLIARVNPRDDNRRSAVLALAEALEVTPDSGESLVGIEALNANTKERPLETASRQWAACDALTPSVDYVRFNRRLVEEELGRPTEIGFWTELASGTRSDTTKSGALLWVAHACSSRQGPDAALDLVRTASRLHDQSVLNAYYRMKYGTCAGAEKDARTGLERLAALVDGQPPLRAFIRRQVVADRPTWSSLGHAQDALATKLSRAAPDWLSALIERSPS